MSQFTTRPATLNDAEIICEFQINLASETEALTLDSSNVRRGVLAVFEDSTKGTYYVAEDDSCIVGCLLTISEWSDWRCGSVLWIHSVFVRPDYRGQGVFRKMYYDLQEVVNGSSSIRGLRLYVDKRNIAAQRVYERIGMDNDHYMLFEWLR